MTRPFLVVAGATDQDIRLTFEYDGAFRDASTLSKLLFGLAWPQDTRLRISLHQAEEVSCVIKGDAAVLRAHRARERNPLAEPPACRGELSIGGPVSGAELKPVLERAVSALESLRFRSIEIHNQR